MLYYLDLFAGIGGFALGAAWAGLRVDRHFFSEVDPYAIKVYRKRFPDAEPLGDVCGIRGADLPAGEWTLSGGFPCQDISIAGDGAGLAGARSGLWFEYARLIGELRPRFAILENVGALAFRGLDSVLGSLAEIGYDAVWFDIRASDMGAPHRRERIWIVAYPGHGSGRNLGSFERRGGHEAERAEDPDPTLRPSGEPETLANPAGERRSEAGIRGREPHGAPGRSSTVSDPGLPGLPQSELEALFRAGWGQEGRTASECGWWSAEPDVGRVAHGIPARVDRLKGLGNSIVPQIAEMIFRGILEELDGPSD